MKLIDTYIGDEWQNTRLEYSRDEYVNASTNPNTRHLLGISFDRAALEGKLPHELAIVAHEAPNLDAGKVRRAYDVWGSDENDRSCWGVVAIDFVPEYGYGETELDYMALDVAIQTFVKAEIRDKLEFPFMDAAAVYNWHLDDCECHGERFTDEDDDETQHECCEYCYVSETIAVEPCDDPESDYWHHSRVKLEDI